MVLNIRNAKADRLARTFAAMEGREITEAVIVALEEAIARRAAAETPRATALRLLAAHGIVPSASAARPVSAEVWHDLDGDFDVR